MVQDLYKSDDSWMDAIDLSDRDQVSQALDERDAAAFNGLVGIHFLQVDGDCTIGYLDITEKHFQPFGVVHGGVTLSLIEAVASRAVDARVDLTKERPFGVHIEVDHKKPGKVGRLRCSATFSHQEKNKQFWDVRVIDDEDETVSEGVFVTKIVSLERLAQKDEERRMRASSASS